MSDHNETRDGMDAKPRACPVCGRPVGHVVQHYARIGEWFDPLKDGMQGGETVVGHATVYPCQCNVAPGSWPGDAEKP